MKTYAFNTLARVKAALEKGGYGDNEDIHEAHFDGWNDRDIEVHVISFINSDGVMDSGYVYIDKDGKGDF